MQYRNRMDELDEREKVFVHRAAETSGDARQAAIDARYALSTARTDAYQWIKDPGCKPAVFETYHFLRMERLKQFSVEVEEVRKRAWEAATADPAEFVEIRRVCCRYCHGSGHAYQWTLNELKQAVASAERMHKAFPQMLGGIGFDATKPPNPGCPECNGEGHEIIRPKDTRDLSPGARMIFKGVKRTKGGGFEVVTQDQGGYLKLYAELCGFRVNQLQHTGKDGAPLQLMPDQIVLVPYDPNAPEEADEE